MESLIFAANAVLPIVLTVALGYILKRIGFMNESFARMANKLCFRVFLPTMLFLNVYKIESIGSIETGYILYTVMAVLVLFLAAFPIVHIATKNRNRRGVLCQAAFRSNYALIGIPLAESLFGEEGVAAASVLSAVVIVLFNVLAVICLSVYRKGKPSFKKIILDILKNPLIISIGLGIVVLLIRPYTAFRISDITPVYKVLGNLSGLATPMALLVLGAQFEFSTVAELRREIIWGVGMRCLMVPVLGLGTAYLIFKGEFTGAEFAALTAVFTTPLAVSSVAMAQEMDGDVKLAGQLVIWTTLISAFTTFIASFLLKSAGIF